MNVTFQDFKGTAYITGAVDEGSLLMVDAANTTYSKLYLKAATAGAVCVGLLKDGTTAEAAGEPRAVYFFGNLMRVKVDGSGTAIAVGDKLKADAASKGVKSTTAGDLFFGYALEASTADGDFIWVLIAPMGVIHA